MLELKIESEQHYNSAMKQIDVLMHKGEEMSDNDAAELRTMALAAQAYESTQYEITNLTPTKES
jgi:antitoxin component HigA of HigAB toxin-antitoxin module